jgi:cell fate regulator YaaT (PSP1 superfamily)
VRGVERDPYILSRRVRQMHRLPWLIPASVVMRMTDEDLDSLDLAERTSRDAYWLCLNRIVTRYTSEAESRWKA